VTTLTTTEHGLELDEAFAAPASEDVLQAAAEALRGRGHTVLVVDDPAAARTAVLDLLPPGRSVFTMSSETLKAAGLDEEINTSGRYEAIRPRIYAMDFPAQQDDIRRLGASADVVVGSVHAVTADGTIVTTSATGSQLGLHAFGAGKVVHVVGAQKLVPDLDTALRRIRLYSWPREDVRFRAEHDRPSIIGKTLITEREVTPGRSTVVLLRTAAGF
jgi:hypothetical protein